eukprot:1037899-Amphidinium_carterae.1
MLGSSPWPATTSLRHTVKLAKVRPSRPACDVGSTFATLKTAQPGSFSTERAWHTYQSLVRSVPLAPYPSCLMHSSS